MSKLTTIDEAVADIADGSSVGLGGWIFYGQPMALVRALIRKGARNLDLVPTPGSIAPDMLIGAGCARSTVCVFISFEQFGLAPHFRRRAEAGTLKVIDLDGPAIAGGLRAAICDLASPFFDAMLAQASRRIIVSVDRIVSSETIRRNNHLIKLPSVMVDAVVEAPWGAHPTASPGLYRADERHLKEYVKASVSDETFGAYLQKYVHTAGAQAAYLDLLGGSRLAGLSVSESTLT